MVASQDPDFYRDRIFELVPSRDKCINVLGVILKNNDILVEYMSYI
jgi:hypothetical protein